MKKRIISILFAVLMVCAMIPLAAVPAFAAESFFEVDSDRYIDRSFDEASNTMVYTAKTIPADAGEITSGTEVLSSGLYVVEGTVVLDKRPTVQGNVGIILKNGAELTANKGITVEEGNTLSIYAQTDDESSMGKLSIAATEENSSAGVTAIGGRNGSRGADAYPNSDDDGGNGGSGCNGGNVNFYGGRISLKSSGAVCIGGGNGGDGGKGGDYVMLSLVDYGGAGTNVGNGGNGGSGGGSGKVYFYGGNIRLDSAGAGCIGGGKGGKGGSHGAAGYRNGSSGSPGSFKAEEDLIVYGTPVMKAGKSAESVKVFTDVTEYTNQSYLSVLYDEGAQSVKLLVPFAQLQDYRDKHSAGNVTVDTYSGEGIKTDSQNGTLTVSGNGSIPDKAFAGVFGIQKVVIEDGVTGIGNGAFAGSEFSSVQIPGSVQYIGNNAFDYCYNLSSVTISAGNLQTIGNRAFFMCQSLSEITIPANVESIGAEAFASSGLEKIVFQGDCSIGENAFRECDLNQPLTVVVPSGWTHGTDEWYGAYSYGLQYVISEPETTENIIEDEPISDNCDHRFTDYVVDIPATCMTPGVETVYCSICHTSVTREIPKDPNVHVFSTEWSFDETHHWHEPICGCDVDVKADYAEHDRDLSVSGYPCRVCGAEVSWWASTLSEGNVWILCALGVAAVVAVGAIVIGKKKRVRNEE